MLVVKGVKALLSPMKFMPELAKANSGIIKKKTNVLNLFCRCCKGD